MKESKKKNGPRAVMGIQPVREAIRVHGAALHKVLVAQSQNPRLDALARFASDSGAAVLRVTKAELDKISAGVRHQGALAYAPDLKTAALSDLEIGPDTLILALDGITDPQNFGALIRSAVALKATAVLWGEHHAAPLTPATFRASAGAIEHARLCQVRSLRSAVTELGERGCAVIALEASADRALEQVVLIGPVVIVIGSEDKGVRRGVLTACNERVRLPMSGAIDSLNASVASAVALYEVGRQRRRG